MAKFDYKKWVTENKYGKLDEQPTPSWLYTYEGCPGTSNMSGPGAVYGLPRRETAGGPLAQLGQVIYTTNQGCRKVIDTGTGNPNSTGFAFGIYNSCGACAYYNQLSTGSATGSASTGSATGSFGSGNSVTGSLTGSLDTGSNATGSFGTGSFGTGSFGTTGISQFQQPKPQMFKGKPVPKDKRDRRDRGIRNENISINKLTNKENNQISKLKNIIRETILELQEIENVGGQSCYYTNSGGAEENQDPNYCAQAGQPCTSGSDTERCICDCTGGSNPGVLRKPSKGIRGKRLKK
jgi:hypothetical protein